jgi:hypothetical protein
MSWLKPQMKLHDFGYEIQESYDVLQLPDQLKAEPIDAYIDMRRNVLVIDDPICRKKMNKYRSIAERLLNRVHFDTEHAGLFSRGTEKMEKVLELDEFADIREIVVDEILPVWKIDDFVNFFCNGVHQIMSKRQMSGEHRVINESFLQSCKRNYRSELKPSVKQECRSDSKFIFRN